MQKRPRDTQLVQGRSLSHFIFSLAQARQAVRLSRGGASWSRDILVVVLAYWFWSDGGGFGSYSLSVGLGMGRPVVKRQ